MEETRKKLKPYHGIIVLALAAFILFFLNPNVAYLLGLYGNYSLYGTLLGQFTLLALAVVVVLLAKVDLKTVFPIKRLKLSYLFGAVLLWWGALKVSEIIQIIMMYFFPEGAMEVNQQLTDVFMSASFVISLTIVSLAPAVCEEAVFRGVALQSFRGHRSKWVAILAVSAVFGAFHGSIFRFFGTMILGVVFAYIVVETDNILYSCVLHALNNGISIVTLFVSNLMSGQTAVQEEVNAIMANGVPLMTIGAYVMRGAAVPFLLYVGNYLIHKKTKPLFGKGETKKVLLLFLASFAFLLVGFLIIAASFILDKDFMNSFMY